MKHGATAALLIVAAMGKHFGWQFSGTDVEIVGQVWNIGSSVLSVAVLILLGAAYRSREMWAACLVLAACEVVIGTCSVAWLVNPWEMLPGDDFCSARVNLPLGILGAVAFLGVLLSVTRETKK